MVLGWTLIVGLCSTWSASGGLAGLSATGTSIMVRMILNESEAFRMIDV